MTGAEQRPQVQVLLATYNGERYLREQLDSLLSQSERGFSILVSDDGSSDATMAILQHYDARFPGLITILPPTTGRMGPCRNFARLIDAASADYLFFCDQDDVWLPDKVARSLAIMGDMEDLHGSGEPTLLHTDLAVVDADLHELSPSFFAYSNISPSRNTFSALLLGNVVTGCTTLVNRALYELARPVPREALMYDHWLAQVAAGLGRIIYLDEPTVLYRQHGGNVIGARHARRTSLLKRVKRTLMSTDVLRVLSRYTQHAAVLAARFGNRLGSTDLRQARVLAGVWTMPRHRRIVAIATSGLFKPSLPTNLGLFALLLRDGRPERFASDW